MAAAVAAAAAAAAAAWQRQQHPAEGREIRLSPGSHVYLQTSRIQTYHIFTVAIYYTTWYTGTRGCYDLSISLPFEERDDRSLALSPFSSLLVTSDF